jgi:TRAP-type C4-dicarboxylate transport system substrate-binding protein
VLPREVFLNEVAEQGLEVHHEWHEGYRSVTTKQPLEGEHA